MAAASLLQYLLDTNILVHLIRRSPLGQWIETTYSLWDPVSVPLICEVTEGEIRSLARQFGWGPTRLSRLQELIDYFVPVRLQDDGVFEAYAVIDQFCRTSRTIGDNDIWIAATAHVTGARLLTTDRDFDHLTPAFLQRDYIDPQSRP